MSPLRSSYSLISFGLLCAIVGLQFANTSASPPWKEFVRRYEQIFTSKPPTAGGQAIALEPKETLESLKLLRTIKHGGRFPDKLNNVNDLIEFCKPEWSKCSLRFFDRLDKFEEANMERKLNLLPYLEYCKLQQIDYCNERKNLAQVIMGERNKLTHKEEDNIQLLRQCIAKVSKGSKFYRLREPAQFPTDKLAEGMMLYVTLKNKLFLKYHQTLDWDSDKDMMLNFYGPVRELCQEYNEKMALLERLATRKDKIKDSSFPEYAWLTNQQICASILSDLSKPAGSSEIISTGVKLISETEQDRISSLLDEFRSEVDN